VGEARKDAAPAQVDSLRARKGGLVRADGPGNELSGDRQRPRSGEGRVQRANDALLEDHRCNPIGPGRRMSNGMRFVPLIIVASAALALSACGSGNGGETNSAASPGGAKEISVSATEFSFDPGTIQIDQPGAYTFTLTNDGSV